MSENKNKGNVSNKHQQARYFQIQEAHPQDTTGRLATTTSLERLPRAYIERLRRLVLAFQQLPHFKAIPLSPSWPLHSTNNQAADLPLTCPALEHLPTYASLSASIPSLHLHI